MKPTAEFERRAERFIKAYYKFKETGTPGNFFPSLYRLIIYCIFRSPSMIAKFE